MCDNRGSRAALCARGGTENSLLRRRDVMTLGPNLTYHASSDIGFIDPFREFLNNQIGKRVSVFLLNERRVYDLAIPSGASDDMDA
jgi:hypothetical protein